MIYSRNKTSISQIDKIFNNATHIIGYSKDINNSLQKTDRIYIIPLTVKYKLMTWCFNIGVIQNVISSLHCLLFEDFLFLFSHRLKTPLQISAKFLPQFIKTTFNKSTLKSATYVHVLLTISVEYYFKLIAQESLQIHVYMKNIRLTKK